MTDCTLCELPTPDPAVSDADVDGEFCCRGCLEVYRTLGDVDVEETANLRDELEAEIDTTPGGETAYLAVDGMHCATCEVFLEATATASEGVHDASASYATDTMRVRYDPDVLDSDGLPEIVSGTGYTARHRQERREESSDVALARFLIGGGMFGMMAMVWYVMFLYPTYFGYEPVVDLGGFDGLYLFGQLWLLTSLVLFYTGYPILRGAYVSLRAGQPNMDLLVALAASGSYLYSTVAMLVGRTDLYFDVTIAIILVVTAGGYYEASIKRRASGLLSDLTAVRVSEATLPDGRVVDVSALEPGDEVVVEPGERVPIDGTVASGTAAVDESLVTGESLPRTKRPGDDLRGGTVVTDSPIVMAVGEEATSTLDRLVELLWDIQSTRSGVQRFADRLATVFVPLVVVLSTIAGVATVAVGGSATAGVLVGLTVLIVSCPCALGLATPLAVASGTKTAAERNVVIASEAVFEEATDIDVVALDKTGTLTSGRMAVHDRVATATPDAELLAVAASLERFATHPAADAVVSTALDEGIRFGAADGGVEIAEPVTDDAVGVVEFDGATESISAVEPFDRGVRGTVGGRDAVVGHPDCFDGESWTGKDAVSPQISAIRDAGNLPVVVGWDGVVRGVIAVGDRPREEWDDVVESLSAAGTEVVVLTGDDEAATARYRADDRIAEVFAGVPPEAKAETIRRLRDRGTTAMVGDGTNDAPALAAADLGIAFGGTKLATDAADAVVIEDDLRAVLDVFDVAAATKRRIRQNLGWAFCYNAIAIPLAITGLLNPLFAAVAMALSSVLVVTNSTRKLLPPRPW